LYDLKTYSKAKYNSPLYFFSLRDVVSRYDGNKDVFAADARQVFSNCAYYNEDKSEVCSLLTAISNMGGAFSIYSNMPGALFLYIATWAGLCFYIGLCVYEVVSIMKFISQVSCA